MSRPLLTQRRRLCLALAASPFTITGTARAALRDGEPPPYIPTPQQVVERMLEIGGTTAADFVIDLGCGDGRIVITAARRFGARGLGVEIRPNLVTQAREAARQAGVGERARFELQDALRTDLSQATVLTLYLGPELNDKLMPRILQTMRPGSRVVSHDFPIGGWEPDRVERFDVPEKNFGRGGESVVMLWIVPANVHGRWRATIADPAGTRSEDLSIAQSFQRIEGAAHRGQRETPLAAARVNGARVTFEVPGSAGLSFGQRFEAEVQGDEMRGTVRIAARDGVRQASFAARRIGARPDLR